MQKPDLQVFKKAVLLIIIIALTRIFSANAQVTISGKVLDESKKPLSFANVSINGSFDGGSTNDNGHYEFKTTIKGDTTLVFAFVGFETVKKKISIGSEDIVVNVNMKETQTELNTVTISAGSFEASDAKKGVVLKPLDIVTTAGASGDIDGAIKTLPGAQRVGETEGLFVRGGTAGETKTLIDDMVVANPYFSSVPDVPQRGRFSPFLFSGTAFSTGGYSAEYGQALSSVLSLTTSDLADESTTGISLMEIGLGLSRTQRWKHSQLSVEGSYTNLDLLYKINPQNRTWTRTPVGENADIIYRLQTSKTGIFKFYGTYSTNTLGLNFNDVNHPEYVHEFSLTNYNYYSNMSYKDLIGGSWLMFVGASYSYNHDGILLNNNQGLKDTAITNIQQLAQGKVVFTKFFKTVDDVKFGFEEESAIYSSQAPFFKYFIADSGTNATLSETYFADFAETDIFFTRKLAGRFGVRAEHSEILGKYDAAPRASLAYKTGQYSQVSLAYGMFYETPDKTLLIDNLYLKDNLNFEKATHYIANYQFMNDNRTFRVEGYYKSYQQLVVEHKDSFTAYFPNRQGLDNSGHGYAQGVDVFYRDKSIKNIDYWVSYSYLDTKRLYLDYPILTQPTFAATNTLNVVYKQMVTPLNTSFGATFTYATGRPYYNPADAFLSDRTPPYRDLSINASYLTAIKGNFTVVFVSLSNVLGFNNVYYYQVSTDGKTKNEIGPPSLRMFFVGMFISIGTKPQEPNKANVKI